MEKTSVKYRILEAAKPYLENLTVKDLVVGISLIAVQLSDESVGVSYVLRYALPPECGAFGYARNAIGMPAWDVAKWTVEGEDNVARSIGGAVLSAASQQLDIADDTDDKCRYGMEITSEDTVGMIGFIKPVAKTLKSQVKKLYVFDEGVSLYEGTMRVCGMDQQPVLLPECTKMIQEKNIVLCDYSPSAGSHYKCGLFGKSCYLGPVVSRVTQGRGNVHIESPCAPKAG